ncbi:SusC/RagA family TonB-linked outer membrane protein [Chitinophaga sp. sic0106]|uniref:SusC/RagA family TonB-linked outer membrane protein n=1 Tax=Chitinophaga sp. sic0106 TaxID=2854785 RepID=UPI001C4839BF|nr:SusC/RagA family TonB-linked outer membrane protein [Chitinophaga sp. sic0106]MBV7532357.1 SusC/RagA family TonB-linked outer membrane protein [Chitinophaga sp. sic0106]
MKLLRFKWAACPRTMLLFLLCCFLSLAASAQFVISGKVTDEKGTAVPGITIAVRNTNQGAQTDADGKYTVRLTQPAGTYTLVFSGIGFQQQQKQVTVSASGSTTVDATMAEDVSKLDEVVVTGTSAGTTRRQLGSYISSVKADALNKGATSNVLTALQGKTAGAQIIQNSGDPSGAMSVRLRGISTISGSSEPLYIIDGVIIDNSTTRVTNTDPNYNGGNTVGTIGQSRMADINPADIERIEVLNGAAAAAIYGSRANAGVVQIFTKRGAEGKPVVNFSTSFNLNEIRKKLEVNKAPTKFGGDPNESTQNNIGTPPLTTATTPVSRYDYQDYIFRTGVGTDNNVSVAGGRDKTKYFASASYMYNQGIIRNTDFSRYSFRLNLDQEITKWLTFNGSMNYVYSKSNEKPDGNTFYSPMNSITILGNYYDIQKRDAIGNLMKVGNLGRVNPVSIIEDFDQRQTTGRIIAGAGLSIKPIKNLSIDYKMGIDNYSQNGTTLIPPYAYFVSTGFYGGGNPNNPTLNGYSSAATNVSFMINHDVNATYNAQISENFSSVTQVGYSVQYQKMNYTMIQGRGLPPFVQSAAKAATIIPGEDQRTELSIAGEFIQQNFKYKDQLFITGALRLDGSSVFGKDERNQLYSKLSGSYVLSGADYWKNSNIAKWWTFLKFRAAYGESGNLTGIPAYARFNTYNATAFIGASAFQSPLTYTDPNVKPERQQELEFGTDMAFLGDRIGLSVNYYRKKVKDLLIARAIAPTDGFTSYQANIGTLENNGIEVVLNATPVKTKDFRWDFTGIFNRNRNKATDIGGGLILYNNIGGASVSIAQNEPIGFFYGAFYARDNSGNIIKDANGIPLTERGVQNTSLTYTPGRDGNGLPTGAVLNKKIGDPNPDYTSTITNDFTWKSLTLHTQLDIVQGVDVFNADYRTRQGVDNGKVAEAEDLGLLPRGYINGVYQIQEFRIDDGSFVKLREVALSYNFGKIKGFSDLTVMASGRNLVSWDNYKGYDPEVNAAGQSTLLRGIDFGAVPIPRTYSIGVRAKF